MRAFILPLFVIFVASFSSIVDANSDNVKAKKVADKEKTKEKKNIPESEELERMVMPFSRWVEGKLHASPIVNPINKRDSKKTKKIAKLGIRQAIKSALKQYPGTVLSVDKSNKADIVEYRVKIISSEGVINIVSISEVQHKMLGRDK